MTKLLTGKYSLVAVAFLIGAATMTAFGASAFDGANLTDEQKQVMEEVRALHESGDFEEARALLETSGIDIKKLHRKFGEDMPELTDEQKAILEQAKALMESGDRDGAKALLEANDLRPPFGPHGHDGEMGERPELTDEQKAILDEAKALKESGDEEGARALLEANDLRPPFGHGPRFGEKMEKDAE